VWTQLTQYSWNNLLLETNISGCHGAGDGGEHMGVAMKMEQVLLREFCDDAMDILIVV
jgi:hypothetical protein